DGEALFEQACRKGWEGLIAKRGSSSYVGRRSPDWLKFKCVNEQEFVIGGFTDPKGSRVGFGALLIGYHEGDRLRYAGKVGTGCVWRHTCMAPYAPAEPHLERAHPHARVHSAPDR